MSPEEILSAVQVPEGLLLACRTLQGAGHQAVLVGGAVRDALLGRDAHDWDLATSATPDEVMVLFAKTIPTGLQHGTVTAVVEGEPIEITTFRGEGTYEDGRHPTEVTFLTDLREDLARRDFTVNAFAWDPINKVFTDDFNGLADLEAEIIRAVGNPAERFAEDGLRTMRAVRFCATLGFELDPATRDAIPGAVPVFKKVSRERIWTELKKMLVADEPPKGLVPFHETGLWSAVFPQVAPLHPEFFLKAAGNTFGPEPVMRLARIFGSCTNSSAALEAEFETLKPSNVEKLRMHALLHPSAVALYFARFGESLVAMRQAAAKFVGIARGEVSFEEVFQTLGLPWNEGLHKFVEEACEGVPLTLKGLAISGKDLEGIVPKGPEMGQALKDLHKAVLLDPALNIREDLLVAAAAWQARQGGPMIQNLQQEIEKAQDNLDAAMKTARNMFGSQVTSDSLGSLATAVGRALVAQARLEALHDCKTLLNATVGPAPAKEKP